MSKPVVAQCSRMPGSVPAPLAHTLLVGLPPRGRSCAALARPTSAGCPLDGCCCCCGCLAGSCAVVDGGACAPRSSVCMACCTAGPAAATADARCLAPSVMDARSASDTRSSSSLPA